MRNLIITATLAALGTGVLLTLEHQNRDAAGRSTRSSETASAPAERFVHAAGRVEGQTESLFVRPEFAGIVATVNVSRGDKVNKGDPLIVLDEQRYRAQRDLAAASLASARAQKMILVAGARETEIEAARQDALSAEARLERSERTYERAGKLFDNNAISQQALDDYRGEFESNRAMLLAARQRYETIKAPPRPEDIAAADAAIASAEATLQLAEIDLRRCTVSAPVDGVILDVELQEGEWISPQMEEEAAIEMANLDRLRVVADVDERDALLVQVGQTCEVTADAVEGGTFAGRVVEIEPRMDPKKIYGGWAGERNETHSRRVWIDLLSETGLPIGLPVEVKIVHE